MLRKPDSPAGIEIGDDFIRLLPRA